MNDATYDAYLAQELPTARELRALFPPDAALTLFDVGACEGEDSLRYARLFPRARIFAFEPLAANQALIRRHFARHQATRCELVPHALSDRTGVAALHVSSGTPEQKFAGEDWNYGNKSSSLLPPGAVGGEWLPWLRFETAEEVRTLTLDQFCAERAIGRIDFVHMDVQGAEGLVLQGARHMLPRITALWLEVAETEVYRGQKLRGEIEALLAAAGFAITFSDLRGVEGDQFYVNRRHWRGRRRIASVAARRWWRALRRGLDARRRRPIP